MQVLPRGRLLRRTIGVGAATALPFLIGSADAQVATYGRPDIVATFNSGSSAIVELDNSPVVVPIADGSLSVTSHDGNCTASIAHPCHYTINSFQLHTGSFSIGGENVDDLHIFNWKPIAGQTDELGIIQIPNGTQFNASATVNGSASALGVNAGSGQPNSAGLVFAFLPENDSISLLGNFTGQFNGHDLDITILATADTPLANRPPVASAGPPQTLVTDCVANVQLDSSGTSDPDNNLAYSYYTEAGFSIGNGSTTVPFLPGQHTLTLVSEDTLGARDTDDVLITVNDSGATPTVPGTLGFAVPVPASLQPESVALEANTFLSMASNSQVLSTSNVVNLGASIATLAPNSRVDNLWSRGGVALAPNALVVGDVNTAGPVSLKPNAKIDGAINDHATIDPLVPLGWNVVSPPNSGGDISLKPNGSQTITPATYGAVSLGSSASLSLRPGTYVLSSLDMGANASATVLDDGSGAPTYIYVTQSLGSLGSINPGSGSLLIGYSGTSPVTLRGRLHGTLVANKASVEVDHVNCDTTANPGCDHHLGAIFAASISLQANAIVEPQSFPWSVFRTGRGACALTPTLKCVASTGSGYTAHFGYSSLLTYAGITVPTGPANQFEGTSAVDGQPISFLPGSHPDAFTVSFDGSPITWVLGSRSVIASKGSTPCP